jgi:Putative restriction endonuclease
MAKVAEKPMQLEAELFSSEEGQVLFTYQDALKMEKAGILPEDRNIELLGGHFYTMTIKPPHAMAVGSFAHELSAAFYGKAGVLSQHPLRVSEEMRDINLPQPDVMLTRKTFYLDHPRPRDVYLLIEVSDSTLKKDKLVKLPLYADAGVAEVWIVNLIERLIEVYLLGEDQNYRLQGTCELTATLAPSAFPDVARQWLPEEIHQLLDKFKI